MSVVAIVVGGMMHNDAVVSCLAVDIIDLFCDVTN